MSILKLLSKKKNSTRSLHKEIKKNPKCMVPKFINFIKFYNKKMDKILVDKISII